MTEEGSETVQKTWTIVKFIDEDTVAMVPTVWITNNENGWNCLWPPLPANKITFAIKNHQINTCWPSFKVILFRNATYDDYQLARKAVLKAEETSDLNTDIDVPAKRKRTTRTISSSSDEENILIKIKTPPKFNGQSSIKADYKKVKMVTQNLGPILESGGNDEQNTKSSEQRSLPDDKNQKPTDCSNNCICCPVHVHYTKEILRQVMFIKSRINDIPIEPVLNSSVNHLAQQFETTLFKNPVSDNEALSELNNSLKNADFFEKAVHELSRIGGRNIYDFCVRCLKKLITNEIANQYSWLGRRNKNNFSEMEISKLIIAAAEAGGKAKDRKEVEDAVSGWLRRANDRIKSKRN